MDGKAGLHGLPIWETLSCLSDDRILSEAEQKEIIELRQKKPDLLIRIARLLLSLSGSGYTYQKFASCPWEDIVDLIHDQAARNRLLQQDDPKEQAVSAYLNREHNQLPCTLMTARKRVLEARRLCKPEDPVLVLGDDDMVGVELAKAGFTDVTSVEIDDYICQQLKERSKAEGLSLKVHRHDIRKPPLKELIRPYHLIFLDPMYSLEGIEMFLRSALEFSGNRPGTYFFVSVHLQSLLRDGFSQLPQLIASLGLSWGEVYKGFNAYPVPDRVGWWIAFFIRRFMKTQLMSSENFTLKFFLSDAMILKNEKSA
ncbi:MAG: bis-aminopropyl spermidine synthase family protein [Deltaproteobacteria bacterium]|nr:bis-aminopropyl spermidine synthase family protein [Deltaproteobacteria bacterium]